MVRTKAFRALAWTAAVLVLIILVCGATSVSLIVGDWLFTETEVAAISWFIGITVMLFASVGIGVGFGFFLSQMDAIKRTPPPDAEPPHVTDALETMLSTAPTPVTRRD